MKKSYPKVGFNTKSKQLQNYCYLLLSVLLLMLLTHNTYAEIALSPYSASYITHYKGLSAQLQHSLKRSENGSWQLRNKTSLLFTDFIEESFFIVQNNQLQPISYHYKNPLSSKRSSQLRFNWEKNTVTDNTHPTPTLNNLPNDALDNLTFQLQLRLDLIKQGEGFTEKTYTLVDRNRLKTYTITYLGQETITTPAGTFSAIKLKQQRPGKERYTTIWLAKDWNYFILQLERIKKGESRYKLALETAPTDNINALTVATTQQTSAPIEQCKKIKQCKD